MGQFVSIVWSTPNESKDGQEEGWHLSRLFDCILLQVNCLTGGRNNGEQQCQSLRDFGSERFFGDFWFSSETNGRPAVGTATLPPRMMFLALTSRPYRCRLAEGLGRSVEPSSDTPANNPRARE